MLLAYANPILPQGRGPKQRAERPTDEICGAGGLRSETNLGSGWPLRPRPADRPTSSATAELSLEWQPSGTSAASPSSLNSCPASNATPSSNLECNCPASCGRKVAGGGVGHGRGGGNVRPARAKVPVWDAADYATSLGGGEGSSPLCGQLVIAPEGLEPSSESEQVGPNSLYLIPANKSTSAIDATSYKDSPAIQLPNSEGPKWYRQAWEANRSLAEGLEWAGLLDDAIRVRECHTRFRQYRCSQGHVWVLPHHSCHFRLCAFRLRERSERAAEQLGPILRGIDRPKHLVLAMPNAPLGELKQGIRRLWAAFARLRRKPIWDRVRGAVAALEVTFNGQTQSWHPHLHIVLDAPFLPQEDWLSAWREASGAGGGESRTCWIGKADSRAVHELVKYITKPVALARYPQALKEFIAAMKGVRCLRSYGSLYGLRLRLASTSKGKAVTCPDCGLPGEVADVMGWTLGLNEVVWDDRGILRPRRPP